VRRSQDEPPAGWVSIGNVLKRGVSVFAYGARGQSVRGTCDGANGCRRTITLDPRELGRCGMGQLSMDQIQKTHRCNKLEGCILSFHDLPADIELTLDRLTGKPHVRVRLKCRGCNLVRTFIAEDIIAKLRASKKGDGGTRLEGLGKLISGPCPAKSCGKSNWTVDVLWLLTDTVGWHQMGERMFESMT